MERGLTKQQMIAELTRSSHGDFKQYALVARQALKSEPEFLARLIAWNAKHGSIRDSKTALPLVASEDRGDAELLDNAMAHLALATPRDLAKAVVAARAAKIGHWHSVKKLVARYLHARERNWPWWERTAVNFRSALKELYVLTNTKAGAREAAVLFGGEKPVGSLFEAVASLKHLPPLEAAGLIEARRIPFLVARSAMGKRLSEPDILRAVIERMSPTEVTTNLKALEKLGAANTPMLKAAIEKSMKKPIKGLKATKVVDGAFVEQAKALAEKQADKVSVDGDWLVLADKSGSMRSAVESARVVAASLARMVKGRVWLVFFDTGAVGYDCTGKTISEITEMTKRIVANGGTSVGAGLQWAIGKDFGGIAVVSDGGENSPPWFGEVYKRNDLTASVYLYMHKGEANSFTARCAQSGIAVTEFDMRDKNVDHYSIPNMVQTMRTNRYSLVDEIMATPLLTVAQVLKEKEHDREVEVVLGDEVYA